MLEPEILGQQWVFSLLDLRTWQEKTLLFPRDPPKTNLLPARRAYENRKIKNVDSCPPRNLEYRESEEDSKSLFTPMFGSLAPKLGAWISRAWGCLRIHSAHPRRFPWLAWRDTGHDRNWRESSDTLSLQRHPPRGILRIWQNREENLVRGNIHLSNRG